MGAEDGSNLLWVKSEKWGKKGFAANRAFLGKWSKRVGYLKADKGKFRWVYSGGRWKYFWYAKSGQLWVKGGWGLSSPCYEIAPFVCYRINLKNHYDREVYIAAPKAGFLFFVLPNDAWPTGYEPLRVFKR